MISIDKLKQLPHNYQEPIEQLEKRIDKAWKNIFRFFYEPEPEFNCFNANRPDIYLEHTVDFSSICEHHFLPYFGKCIIKIRLDKTYAGLSKYNRAIKWLAGKPSTQENLTSEFYNYLYDKLNPISLNIETICQHTCIICRGVEAINSTTTVKIGERK